MREFKVSTNDTFPCSFHCIRKSSEFMLECSGGGEKVHCNSSAS